MSRAASSSCSADNDARVTVRRGARILLGAGVLLAPLLGPAAGTSVACTLVEADAVAGLVDGDCGPEAKACPVPGTFDDQRCVSIFDPATSCAVVGNCGPCFFPNGSASCGPDGTCVLEACDFGFRNCDDAVGADVCQTDTRTDPDHCGDCGRSCGGDNGVAGCVNATCTISCAPGFGNCNQTDQSLGDDDGCETRLDTAAACGVCGRRCEDGTACVDGQCTPT